MPIEVTLIQVHGIYLSLAIYLSIYIYLSVYLYTCNRLSGWWFSTVGSLDAVFVTCFSITFEEVSCKYTGCFALADWLPPTLLTGSPRPCCLAPPTLTSVVLVVSVLLGFTGRSTWDEHPGPPSSAAALINRMWFLRTHTELSSCVKVEGAILAEVAVLIVSVDVKQHFT